MNAKIESNIKKEIKNEFNYDDHVIITDRGDGMFIAEFDGETKWVAADENSAIVLPDFDPNDTPLNY